MAIRIGDNMTVITLDFGEDLSLGANAVIMALPPRSSRPRRWEADIDGNTIYYVTYEGDLDVAGTWKLQGYIELPDWEGHSTITTMEVESNLGDLPA